MQSACVVVRRVQLSSSLSPSRQRPMIIADSAARGAQEFAADVLVIGSGPVGIVTAL